MMLFFGCAQDFVYDVIWDLASYFWDIYVMVSLWNVLDASFFTCDQYICFIVVAT